MSPPTKSAALQIWSHVFCRHFDRLPREVREMVIQRIDEMGRDLRGAQHLRLQGRTEFKLRVGDYRVLYDFDVLEGKAAKGERVLASVATAGAGVVAPRALRASWSIVTAC
eukprot:gene40028-54117_t